MSTGSVRNSARDSGVKDGDNSTASRTRAHLPAERRYQHGDRLPDTRRSVDRVFVSYPQAETADAKAARIKAGKPAPQLQFVVGTIRRES